MRTRQIICVALASSLCSLVGYIPLRIVIAKQQAPNPQAIVVLGGTADRERKAAELAQRYPNLEIWVSSGTSEAAQIFAEAGIARSRIRYDNQAIDTVTNFTTLVEPLMQRQIRHVYLVTSDFHLSRATAIATIVLGSQGITFTSAPIRNPFYAPETPQRTFRDVGRAFLWLFTGQTGARLER